ncbi:hypothetical protein CR513_04705, partial [Mucuna pruriens]
MASKQSVINWAIIRPSLAHEEAHPSINRTFHRFKIRCSEVANSSHHSSAFAFGFTVLKSDNADFDSDLANANSNLHVYISKFSLDNMAGNSRTLKELTTPDIICQPWCIHTLNWNNLNHMSLNPHKHLKEFHGARNLISNMGSTSSKEVNRVVSTNNQRLKKIIELISLVKQLTIGQHHISPPIGTKTTYATYTVEFLGGFGQIDGYKQHLVSTKSDCYNLGLANIDWTIAHQCASTAIQRLIECPICIGISSSTNASVGVVDIVRVMEVVVVPPPLPSIIQPLQPPIIIANKLQAKQKKRLLRHLKKLGDFYEYLLKHSTLRFLLKKPLEVVALELLRW